MTDDMRNAFEEWFKTKRGTGMLGKTPNGGYEWVATSEAAEVWQAATLKERERCALVCEGLWRIDGSFTAKEFADEVRLPLPPTGTEENV